MYPSSCFEISTIELKHVSAAVGYGVLGLRRQKSAKCALSKRAIAEKPTLTKKQSNNSIVIAPRFQKLDVSAQDEQTFSRRYL